MVTVADGSPIPASTVTSGIPSPTEVPSFPFGRMKFRTAWLGVPTFSTAARSPSLTSPIWIVADSPGGPCSFPMSFHCVPSHT